MSAAPTALPPWPTHEPPDVTAGGGWRLWRRVLNVALAETAGLATAWLLTITHQWRVPPPPAALAAMVPGLTASLAILMTCIGASSALGLRVKTERLRLLRARVAASTPAAGSVGPTDHVALFSANKLSRSRLAACWIYAAAGLVVLAQLLRTPLIPVIFVLIFAGAITRTVGFGVAIGPGGVRITSGFRRSLFEVPLPAVHSVRVVDLHLADFRGPIIRRPSRRTAGKPGRAPVFLRVLQDGPALALETCDGGFMVCSLADAPRAAGLVAGLVGLSGPRPDPQGLADSPGRSTRADVLGGRSQ
ncbi:MAG: hypothetical protein ACYCST_05920 [Acidimicrobiales bacterium]